MSNQVSKETKNLVKKTLQAKKKTEKAKTDSVDVKPVIKALDAKNKADGAVTDRVRELYAGCKTADDFRNRRTEIGKAISESVSDKAQATQYKNQINAVFFKYILPEGMVLVNRGASKRKETIAKKKGTVTKKEAAAKARKDAMDADSKAFVASMAKPQAKPQAVPALHDMASLLAAISAITEKASKADCVAMRDRIVNQFATIINSKK